MAFEIREDELQAIALVPDVDLADLAIDLDLIPDAEINRRSLMTELIPRLLELARREGLPFSRWDGEDLEALPSAHREALASCMGWDSSVEGMLRAGKKIYKTYRKTRPRSQVPIFLPILLAALARHAAESPA